MSRNTRIIIGAFASAFATFFVGQLLYFVIGLFS